MTKEQKEIREEYLSEQKKLGANDDWLQYCKKNFGGGVKHNGFLYVIDKPRIKKRFCYGYGYNGVSSPQEEEVANGLVDKAESDHQFFMVENLRNINETIECLSEIYEEMGLNWAEGSYPKYMIATSPLADDKEGKSRIRAFWIVNTWQCNMETTKICFDRELVKKLIEGYEEVKKDFIKRLNAYLKRYGLTKVRSWTFLRD